MRFLDGLLIICFILLAIAIGRVFHEVCGDGKASTQQCLDLMDLMDD